MATFHLPSPAGILVGTGLATEATLAGFRSDFNALITADRGDAQSGFRTDTELTLDSSSGNINNLFVASTDGTIANGTLMRVTSVALADNFTPPTSGLLQTQVFLMGMDPASNDYDRLRAEGNNTDNLSPLSAGVLDINSFLYAYNGSSFDRLLCDVSKNLLVSDTSAQALLTTISTLDFATETTLSSFASQNSIDLGELITNVGDETDAAWSGTGNGNITEVLKANYDLLTNILSALGGSGNAPVQLIYNDYSVTGVTTGSYVELVSDTGSTQINHLSIFDSSGENLVLAIGASGSEVDQLQIFRGGNGREDLVIPANSRISVKALSANASVGELVINCMS